MWRYWRFRWYHVWLLNCTWICWCIIETSSGLPRKSSAIFGHLREFSEILWKCSGTYVRLAFGTILENLRKSSENHQKLRYQYAYIIKRTLHASSKIWILCSRDKNNISQVSVAKLFRRRDERSRTFSENFRRCPKIAEDFRVRPEDVSMIHQRIWVQFKRQTWYQWNHRYLHMWGYHIFTHVTCEDRRIDFINWLPLGIHSILS